MTKLRDRVSYVSGPGGRIAACYWLCRQLLGIDIYGIFSRTLPSTMSDLPVGSEFVALTEPMHLQGIPEPVLRDIDSHSGIGSCALIGRGDRIYALVLDGEVACQLIIAVGEGVTDTPTALKIGVGEKGTFLGFLYTHEKFRRRGLAEQLLELVAARLEREGFARCVCHISMSNVPSLAAFRRAHWLREGFLLATRHGRLIAAPGCRSAGISVQAMD